MRLEWPPDEPLWVDARSMLEASGARFGDGGNYVVCDPEPAHCLVVVGRPAPALIHQALGGCHERVEMLIDADNVKWLRGLFPGWRAGAVIMHCLANELPPPPVQPSARRVTIDDPLEHLPPTMAEEMDRARRRTSLYASFEGRRAVAFAYGHRVTRTLADVSVDTLADHRRKGHGLAAVVHLLHDLSDRGLSPTWGAYESNQVSRQFAARLGFEPVGELWGLKPPVDP